MTMPTLVAALGMVCALGAAPAAAADTVRIGDIDPLSGPLATYGIELSRGHELAVDDINARGGLLGRKVEMVKGDATNPQQAIATVDQLVNRDKVSLFSGTYMSPVAAAASDAAQRYNLLYWETIATAQELTDRGLPNFVRTGPDAASYAVEAVAVIKDLVASAYGSRPGDLKIWIEHEDLNYGTSIAQTLSRLLREAGIKPVGVTSHSFKAIDLNDTVLRIRKGTPDLLIEIGYVPDGNLLLRNLHNQDYKVPGIMYLVIGDAPETLQAVGAEALEGMLVVSYPRPTLPEAFSPGGQHYLDAYRARYRQEPAATLGMTAYAGMQMLFDAVKAAGSTDVDQIRAAAARMDKPRGSYPGGYGVRFDDTFQNTRALPVVVQWQSGEPVTVYPQDAAATGARLKNIPRR